MAQGLRHGCVRARALPVQHLLLGGYKRALHGFQGGQTNRGRFGAPGEEKGGGEQGEATTGQPVVLATLLWGMLYADDAGVVSQSPEQPRKMVGVIVVVYAAFGLTVSDAKVRSCVYTRRGC